VYQPKTQNDLKRKSEDDKKEIINSIKKRPFLMT